MTINININDRSELVITITDEMQQEIHWHDQDCQASMPIQIDEVEEDIWMAQKYSMLAERNYTIFNYVLRDAFRCARIDFDEEVICEMEYPGVDGWQHPSDVEVIEVTVQFEDKEYRIHQREFAGFIHSKEIRISG